MPTRFICPHCHSSIDPLDFEIAHSASQQYLICPECDDAFVLPATGTTIEEVPLAPLVEARPALHPAENCVL